MNTPNDRLAGAIWGHLLGDAAGLPYEGVPAPAIPDRPTAHDRPMRWSDDGALMLAQLESLLVAGPDPEDFGQRALAWYQHGAYTPDGSPAFGIGGTTRAALGRIASGHPAATAGGTEERECGNGSLMRILPVALVGLGPPPALVDAAHALSSVTHAHPRAQAACALYVLIAARLLDGDDPAAALDAGVDGLRREYERFEAPYRRELSLILDWGERRGTGYVVDCLWTAWDAFATAGSFEEAIERAIRVGNDTDTTAAVCGGLAGLHFGIEGIPAGWLARLAGRDIVEPLVTRVTARSQRR